MKRSSLFFCTMLAGAVSACSGNVKETLGLTRQAPDEFRVVARPPLSVPPDFNLRPPAEGSEITGSDVPASKQAEELVFGEKTTGLRPGNASTAVQGVQVSGNASPADERFLTKTGATQADSQIKEKIRAESGTGSDNEKSMLEKLREPSNKEPLVDTKKEAERIKTNEASGKPVTEGETPTVKPRDRGVLDKIF